MESLLTSDRLASLIDEKLAVLESLRELSLRQAGLIASSDMTRLISLLAVKQKTLDGLTAVERKLDPFREQQPEERRWNSPQQKEHCRRAVQQCDALLQEVMQMEQGSETELQARRETAAAQLNQSSGASAARKAYRQAGASSRRTELDFSE